MLATGRLKQRSYESREGEKRTVVELDVDEIGPTLRFATATVVKAARTAQPKTPAAAASVQRDTGQQASSGNGGWGPGYSDEPPF